VPVAGHHGPVGRHVTLRVGVDKKDIIDEQDVLPNSVDVKVKIAGESVEVVP